MQRYQTSYFEMFPGVWRHGDYIEVNEHGGVVIYGRSDATLNRGGVRLGTSDFYAVVEALPEVADSLVVHLEGDDRSSSMLSSAVQSGSVSIIENSELRYDLVPSLERAFEKLQLPLSESLRAGADELAHGAKTKASSHRYTLEEFGLDEQSIRSRFAAIYTSFEFDRFQPVRSKASG